MDFAAFNDEHFVIKFGTELHEIDARTLSRNLAGIVQAIEEINRLINPDFEIEVSVEAFDGGSFLTRITTKKIRKFIGESPREIIVGVLITVIAAHLVTKDDGPKTVTTVNQTITNNIYMNAPPQVMPYIVEVENSSIVTASVKQAFEAVEQDKDVHYYEMAPSPESPAKLTIPRRSFQPIIESLDDRLSGERLKSTLPPTIQGEPRPSISACRFIS